MKFLFDQNVSHRILKLLPEKFKNSTSIKKENLINAADKEIWEFSKQNNYTIVTQDADFNDLNPLYGFPPKIIWIRLGNQKTTDIARLLIEYSIEIDEFLKNNNYGCFEIVKVKTK